MKCAAGYIAVGLAADARSSRRQELGLAGHVYELMVTYSLVLGIAALPNVQDDVYRQRSGLLCVPLRRLIV